MGIVKVLSAIFLFSIFSSIAWICYVLANHASDGINEFVITVAITVLPIFVLWGVFGYIYQYMSASVLNKNMYSLFKQMKKNLEYSDIISKLLVEVENNTKDNIVLSRFDVFISDMNELLADIIKRSQLASSEQIDNLWVKVKNGGKWAFGKVIIELFQAQPNLSDRLLKKALQDAMLGGTILEFCSRYQSLVSALEKHDKERLFLNIIETGVFGKVFMLLAEPADSIRQNRDLTLAHRQMSEDVTIPEFMAPPETDSKSVIKNAIYRRSEMVARQKEEAEIQEKDPLSVAFAKSFGQESDDIKKEPTFLRDEEVIEQEEAKTADNDLPAEISISSVISEETSPTEPTVEENNMHETAPIVSEPKILEQEAEGMPEPKINRDDEYSYPFGGWMNADNYDK